MLMLPAPFRLRQAHRSPCFNRGQHQFQGSWQHTRLPRVCILHISQVTNHRHAHRHCRQSQHCTPRASALQQSGQPGSPPGWMQSLGQALQDQFLPIALVLGMFAGILAPGPGIWAADHSMQKISTFGIFIISGLALRRRQAAQALNSWGSALFGLVSILLITPLTALLALRLPLNPPEFAFGLAVFCCMPCTLSSGVSLTQAIGGNTALALLLTTSSNLLGILTMPFMLCAVLGAGNVANAIQPASLLVTLVQSILIPLSIGAAIRAFIPGARQAADDNKQRLGLLSGCLLALVPWMQVSRSVQQQVSVSLGSLGAVIAAGAALHLSMLSFNILATKALRLGGPGSEGDGIRRAIILVASQKTLPIAVTVLNQLAIMVEGPIGLATIPCVCTHLLQIMIDSVLLTFWQRADERTVGGSDVPTDQFITKVSRNY